MRGYLAGVATVLALFVVGGFAVVWFGWMPAGADSSPLPMERWAAKRSLAATIAREQPQPPYPFGPVTGAVILAGAKGYMANCAVCHGSAGSGESNVSKGQYVRVPQFTKRGVDDDPAGETYWKIENGIRFTGMPSFKKTLTDKEKWQIAYFLKRGMKNLPPDADAVWHQRHGD